MISLIKLIGLLDLGMFALLHETFSYNKYSGCLKTLTFSQNLGKFLYQSMLHFILIAFMVLSAT